MNIKNDINEPATYQIRIQGVLDQNWTCWFEGLSIEEVDGETLITGPFKDQAALRGVLNKIWDLNLTLISLIPVIHGREDYPSTGD
jgi:hypothetical protein